MRVGSGLVIPCSPTHSCTRVATRLVESMRDLRLDRPVARALWRRLSEPHQPRDAPGTGLPQPMRRLGHVSTGEAPTQPSDSAALSSRLSKTRSIWCAAGSSFTCHTSWVAGWVGGWPGGWVACSGTVLSLSGAVRWERCTLQLKTRQTMSILTPSHMPRARWAAKPDTRGAKAETRGARRRNIGDGARTCGRGRWRGWRGGTMQRPYRKTCQRRPDGREPESDCGGRIGAAAIPNAGGAVNADRSSRPSLPYPPS